MNKQVVIVSILAMSAGAAMAQSSVTMYGRIGVGVGKNPGSDEKVVQNSANSRLGVRGVEDLGGGLRAFFQLETRFEPDTGTNSDSRRFWNGASLVGLQNEYGRVWMGRDYTPLFNNVALIGDPWGYAGIAGLDSGMALIGTSRYDNTVNLETKMGAFSATFQVAESNNNGNGAGTLPASKRPFGAALTYKGENFYAGVAYDSRTNAQDKLWAAVATYDFRFMKLFGTYARGTTATGSNNREIVLALTAPVGPGDVRLGYDIVRQTSSPSSNLKQQYSVGYQYGLSKRTFLSADFTTDREVAQSKNGYEFGVKHFF